MNKVIGQTFRDQFIDLDFTHWEKCNFINCMMHTSYGIFRLVESDLANCKLSLGGPALTVARLIQMFYPDRPIRFTEKKE